MMRDKLMADLLAGTQVPLFDLRLAAHAEIERLRQRVADDTQEIRDMEKDHRDYLAIALREKAELKAEIDRLRTTLERIANTKPPISTKVREQ